MSLCETMERRNRDEKGNPAYAQIEFELENTCDPAICAGHAAGLLEATCCAGNWIRAKFTEFVSPKKATFMRTYHP